MDYAFDGYRPGSLAGVVGLHMDYYRDAWGFGLEFETKVALEMAEFLRRMEPGRDLFLSAWDRQGHLAGSVTIDISGGGPQGAHLRWFIVSGETRGKGLGKELMERAIGHCDRRPAPQIWLTSKRAASCAGVVICKGANRTSSRTSSIRASFRASRSTLPKRWRESWECAPSSCKTTGRTWCRRWSAATST